MKLRPYLPDVRDLHVYVGGLLVAIGAGVAWLPAAFIVFGLVLILRAFVRFQ